MLIGTRSSFKNAFYLHFFSLLLPHCSNAAKSPIYLRNDTGDGWSHVFVTGTVGIIQWVSMIF